jgi:hypothetical protein
VRLELGDVTDSDSLRSAARGCRSHDRCLSPGRRST